MPNNFKVLAGPVELVEANPAFEAAFEAVVELSVEPNQAFSSNYNMRLSTVVYFVHSLN